MSLSNFLSCFSLPKAYLMVIEEQQQEGWHTTNLFDVVFFALVVADLRYWCLRVLEQREEGVWSIYPLMIQTLLCLPSLLFLGVE